MRFLGACRVSEATLVSIASVRPSSLDELFAISSVAAKKLETYGEGLLKVVAGS